MSTSLDAQETLSKFTSPLFIPLPASPPPKKSIPSRKPAGWVSVIPRLSSARFVSIQSQRRASEARELRDATSTNDEQAERGHETVDKDLNLSEPKSGLISGDTSEPQIDGECFSGSLRLSLRNDPWRSLNPSSPLISNSQVEPRRFPSTHIPGHRSIGGRRIISGTMQYALLPPSPPSSPPSPSKLVSPPPRPHPTRSSTSPSPIHSTPNAHPAPPSTASPRSEHLQTPLPGLDFHITQPNHYHSLTDDILPTPTDNQFAIPTDSDNIYHTQPDLANIPVDGDSSFRSVSEVDSDEVVAEEEGDEGHDGWVEEVLAEREADEEWMGDVRSQLNAVFPDFLAGKESSIHSSYPTSTHLQHNHQHQHHIPQSVQNSNLGSSQHTLLPDPVSAGRRAVDNLPLPGVRSELGELREEIERLRGVVGGLAEGLGRGSEPKINSKDVRDTEGDRKEVQDLLRQNADQIIQLLSALDTRLSPDRIEVRVVRDLLKREILDDMSERLRLSL